MSDLKRVLRPLTLAAGLGASLALGACQTSQVYNQGYIVDEQTLAQVPVGSSREQVLLALGTPSTTRPSTTKSSTISRRSAFAPSPS